MFLILIFLLSTTVSLASKSSSSSEGDGVEDLLFSLFDTKLSDSSESSGSKEDLKEYAKWIFKKEQEHEIEKMKKDISQEEKDQLKFFENLLENLKKMGKNLGDS